MVNHNIIEQIYFFKKIIGYFIGDAKDTQKLIKGCTKTMESLNDLYLLHLASQKGKLQ